MLVGSVNSSINSDYGVKNLIASAVEETKAAATEANAAAEEIKKQVPDFDTFEKSSETESTYTEPKRLTAEQMQQLQDDQMVSFKRMLYDILNEQSDKVRLATDGISKDLFSNITVTPEQKQAAQEAISEDGEWGVKAVADRIMDMVLSVAGDDDSQLDGLKKAVEKGFEQAEKQWGGELPEIVQNTREELNKRFEELEKQDTARDGETLYSNPVPDEK